MTGSQAERAGNAPAAPAPGRTGVELIRPDSPEWDSYVHSAETATVCHLSGWAKAVERAWRHDPYHLRATRQGKTVGVLPLFHVRSRLFGSTLVSTPNAVYGGPLAEDADARNALVAEARDIARRLRVRCLELRDVDRRPDDGGGFSERELYVTFDHPLVPDENALAAGFPRDVRRMIRLGPKHGLQSFQGTDELLDDFYDVYATSVRNLGTPVFPKRLFAQFLKEFPERSDILLVRQGSRVAGGVLSFYFRDTVLPYYGGARPEFHRAGVNNFMYWELMRRAAARGYRRFDFGRSKIGTGAHAFKRGWGMTERPLRYRYYLLDSDRIPDVTPANPRLQPLIRLWKKLPLRISTLIGPPISRGLP